MKLILALLSSFFLQFSQGEAQYATRKTPSSPIFFGPKGLEPGVRQQTDEETIDSLAWSALLAL
jgi:hypothetical protein